MGLTRRAPFVLLALSVFAADPIASELKKFRDPATEFELLRLTDPSHSSLIAGPDLRPITRNGYLVFSSDRDGTWQPYRMELKTGELVPLAQAAALDPATLTHTVDERNVLFFDGADLKISSVGGQRSRVLYTVPSDWQRTAPPGLADVGSQVAIAEHKGDRSRVRFVSTVRPAPNTILEHTAEIKEVWPRPRRTSTLFRDDEGLWLGGGDERKVHKLKIAEGRVLAARWSGDGRSVHYLIVPAESGRLNQLREHFPDSGEDKLIGNTSQFVTFARNGDSTVFAGVSANKASAHILLLLRVTRREMTVCEHRASDPAKVVVHFAAGSQRLVFQTDRHGKPAIFSIELERFVEKTDQ